MICITRRGACTHMRLAKRILVGTGLGLRRDSSQLQDRNADARKDQVIPAIRPAGLATRGRIRNYKRRRREKIK
jgi:hypothetical protein